MSDPATFAHLACISCGQRAPTILEVVVHCATSHLHMDVAIEDRATALWLLGRPQLYLYTSDNRKGLEL